MKGAVIFTEDEQNKNEEKNFPSKRNDKISLSRDDYRQVIKEAYEEGKEDAIKENGENSPIKKFGKKEFERQGKEEAIQIHAKEEEENLQRFKTISERHEIEIMRATTVFPFTLFPDTLVIDTTKVTIARKQLFATEFVVTIPLKDLADITMQTVLFLGTVNIKYMPQSESPGMTRPIDFRIANLKRADAIRAKNILKGVLVAKAEEIDIAKLPPDEVVKVLEKFGSNEGVV